MTASHHQKFNQATLHDGKTIGDSNADTAHDVITHHCCIIDNKLIFPPGGVAHHTIVVDDDCNVETGMIISQPETARAKFFCGCSNKNNIILQQSQSHTVEHDCAITAFIECDASTQSNSNSPAPLNPQH